MCMRGKDLQLGFRTDPGFGINSVDNLTQLSLLAWRKKGTKGLPLLKFKATGNNKIKLKVL